MKFAGVKVWNKLPNKIKSCFLNVFKKKIKNLFWIHINFPLVLVF